MDCVLLSLRLWVGVGICDFVLVSEDMADDDFDELWVEVDDATAVGVLLILSVPVCDTDERESDHVTVSLSVPLVLVREVVTLTECCFVVEKVDDCEADSVALAVGVGGGVIVSVVVLLEV